VTVRHTNNCGNSLTNTNSVILLKERKWKQILTSNPFVHVLGLAGHNTIRRVSI